MSEVTPGHMNSLKLQFPFLIQNDFYISEVHRESEILTTSGLRSDKNQWQLKGWVIIMTTHVS